MSCLCRHGGGVGGIDPTQAQPRRQMEMGGQRHVPAPLPGTHCTGDCVSFAARLVGHKNTSPSLGSIPTTAQPLDSRYTDYAVPFAYNKVLY